MGMITATRTTMIMITLIIMGTIIMAITMITRTITAKQISMGMRTPARSAPTCPIPIS